MISVVGEARRLSWLSRVGLEMVILLSLTLLWCSHRVEILPWLMVFQWGRGRLIRLQNATMRQSLQSSFHFYHGCDGRLPTLQIPCRFHCPHLLLCSLLLQLWLQVGSSNSTKSCKCDCALFYSHLWLNSPTLTLLKTPHTVSWMRTCSISIQVCD